MLRQQIIVLRPGNPGRVAFLAVETIPRESQRRVAAIRQSPRSANDFKYLAGGAEFVSNKCPINGRELFVDYWFRAIAAVTR